MTKVLEIFSENKKKSIPSQRSIGVGSTGYITAQQKWIVKSLQRTLATNPELKIAIVTCYMTHGFFKPLVDDKNSKVQFFNWMSVLGNEENETNLLAQLDDYDLIYWDFPELEYLKKCEKLFIKYFDKIHQLTIIANKSPNVSESLFYQEICLYFRNHGLPIDERAVPSETKRNKFLDWFVRKSA